jgi:vancomycin resistance protein YoaR
VTETPEYEPIDYAERRRQRASVSRRKGPSPVAVVVGVVAVLIVVVVCLEAALSLGRIHRGVTVAGVDVGGMKPEAATARLRDDFDNVAHPVQVVAGEFTRTVRPSEVGLTPDLEATVARAYQVGREGGIAALSSRWRAAFGGVDVAVVAAADPAAAAVVLDDIAAHVDVSAVDATVTVSGTNAAAADGSDGKRLAREVATPRIAAALVGPARTVKVPVVVEHRAVTLDEARSAADAANLMMSADAMMTYRKKSWTLKPSQIAQMVAFRRSDTATDGTELPPAAGREVTLLAYVAPDKAAAIVPKVVGEALGRKARDAKFSTRGGVVTIIPSQTGIGPDMDRFAAEMTDALTQAGSTRSVALYATRSEPDLTTEEAEAMNIKERISRFTTTYSAGNRPRVNNIHLLGDKLDGTLIGPGETFSFNGVVGERTAAKGYKEANAIVDGKLVPQLGGGICQVGTTLFNAVFDSGLPVVERHNHSFYISHYPKGRDATVSWQGPDLKFQNDTPDWVLVSVSYSSYSITIALYGTDPGYKVTSSTSAWSNERDFPTEEIKDPKLEKGKKVIEDAGITGRRCTVTRTVRKDGKVLRTDKFVSIYRPKVEVVRIGTKPVESKPETTTP